jgi:putative oxidoreductase
MTVLPAAGNRLVDGIARVLIALVFLNALPGKITGFQQVAGVIAAKGVPLAPLVVGSVLLVSGWRSRLGAILLLIFLVPTSLIFHGNVHEIPERIQLLKNVAIIGGLVLVANAPDARG